MFLPCLQTKVSTSFLARLSIKPMDEASSLLAKTIGLPFAESPQRFNPKNNQTR